MVAKEVRLEVSGKLDREQVVAAGGFVNEDGYLVQIVAEHPTEKQVLEIDLMLRKIAKKKRSQYETNSSRLDFEDVVQELWLKALDVWSKNWWFNDFAGMRAAIAHASFGKIVDVVRKEVRRPSVAFDTSMLSWNDYGSESARGSVQAEVEGLSSKFASGEDILALKDIQSLFAEGTKERQGVDLLIGIMCNVEELMPGFNMEDYSDFYELNGCFDWLAKKLGYANRSSSSFQKVRNRIQEILAQEGYANGFEKALSRLQKKGYQV